MKTVVIGNIFEVVVLKGEQEVHQSFRRYFELLDQISFLKEKNMS